MPDLAAPGARQAALAEFHDAVYADSSRATLRFKWRTVLRIFADWGTEPLPPTPGKVALLGATLRAGGYRSAAGYLSLYRTTCAREGYAFGPDLAVAARDAARACARGLGGPVRATPMPLDRLHQLGGGRPAWVAGGPCSPRNALVTGTWWLLREVELSTVRASLVDTSVTPSGLPVVALTLPASKSDQMARGVARSHRCRCQELAAPFVCPAHAVLDQLLFLKRQFPGQWVGDKVAPDLPLFPQRSGAACSKAAMVGTMVAAAGQVGVPLANADGTTRVSGHSLRVGGAQGLARRGFPTWSIQLMGRWGTETVKQYIGDAALDVFTGTAVQPRVTDPTDLTDFISAATRAADGMARPRESRDRARLQHPGPSREEIEVKITDLAGELRTELAEAIGQTVREELAARASPATRPPTTDTGTVTDAPDPTRWAQNQRTEQWHIVAVGPGSGFPSPEWSAWCGWALGLSGGFLFETPRPGEERCKRCIGIAAKRAQRAPPAAAEVLT